MKFNVNFFQNLRQERMIKPQPITAKLLHPANKFLKLENVLLHIFPFRHIPVDIQNLCEIKLKIIDNDDTTIAIEWVDINIFINCRL